MDLPGYIKEFLQTNYYISDEELSLPFDKMPSSLRDLIATKCMNMNKDGEMSPKDEEQILEQARKQFQSDIDSDITSSSNAQVDNFVAHHKTLTGLVRLAEKQEKNPSDFDKAATLLTAKRLASDEYADTPKTLSNFLKVKKEIRTELEVKFFTARYFETHGINADNAGTYQQQAIDDIATISQMVQTNQTDKIATRFNLPDTQEARDNAKGATLSFAMAELKTFADKISEKVKESPFVKSVNSLSDSFQKKYPKTYMAAKLVGNMGMAMTLGPVFSAYRAVTGINGMRKDFAKFKEENPSEKGSFWKFIRSKDGRQKLMQVGQNTMRVIPGMKAVGIVIGAVKNSDGLRNSIKELREGGSSKRAWVKVGCAAVGLLAVSTAAACMNDEVADMVGDFVSHSFGAVNDTVHNTVENVTEHVSALSGIREHVADSVNTAGLTEEIHSLNDIPASNLADTASVQMEQPEIRLDQTAPAQVFEQTPSGHDIPETTVSTPEASNIPETTASTPEASNIPNNVASTTTTDSVEQATTIPVQESDINYYKIGNNSMLVENPNGSNTLLFGRGGTSQLTYQFNETDKGLSLSLKGSISTAMLKGQDAETYNHLVEQARESGDLNPTLTARTAFQEMKIAEAIKANYAANPTPELEAQYNLLSEQASFRGVKLGGISENNEGLEKTLIHSEKIAAAPAPSAPAATLDETKVSTSFSTGDGHSNTTIDHADGTSTTINATRDATTVSHGDGTSYTETRIGKDGDVTARGNIHRDIDPTKDGMTMTRVGYDTAKESVNTVFTNNQTGDQVFVDHDELGDKVGFNSANGSENVTIGHDNMGRTNATARIDNVKLGDDVTASNVNINVGQRSIGGTIRTTDGDEVYVNKNTDSFAVTHSKDGSFNTVTKSDDGSVNLHGNINRDVDPTKDGMTMTHVDYDTRGGSVGTVFTHNQTGDQVFANHDELGDKVGFNSANGSENVTIGHDNMGRTNATARIDNVKLGDDVTASNVNINVGQRSIGGTIRTTDGDEVYVNKNTDSFAVTHSKDGSFNTVTKSDDGSVNLHGSINRDVDPTKDGMTMTHVDYDTRGGSVGTVFTHNQTGDQVFTNHDELGDKAGYNSSTGSENVTIGHDNMGRTNATARIDNVKLGEEATASNVNINAGQRSIGGTVRLGDGNEVYVNKNTDSYQLSHSKDGSFTTVTKSDDGSMGVHGNINRDVDSTKDGMTMTHTEYDTRKGTIGTVFTNNKTGDHVFADHDELGNKVGFNSANGSENVTIGRDNMGRTSATARIDNVKLGDDVTASNVNINAGQRTLGGTLRYGDGNETYVNKTTDGISVTQSKDGSFHTVTASDGKVGLHGSINRAADPTKDGVTVTHVDYNTGKGETNTVLTNNETGRKYSVTTDKSSIRLGTEKNGQSNGAITVDRDGVNIQGKSGKKINVGKVIGFIKGLTR